MRELRQGMKDPSVELWRAFLTRQRFLTGPAISQKSAEFCNILRTATENYQKRNGLRPTGALDQATANQASRQGFDPRSLQSPTPPSAATQNSIVQDNCVFPTYTQLSASQRKLITEAKPYEDLSAKRKACFLNITAALAWVGFTTEGLSLKSFKEDGEKSGIQTDRLLFEPFAESLKQQLESAIANRQKLGDKGFTKDKPDSKFHDGMDKWGGRQLVTRESLQIGGGDKGAFVDIDRYGSRTDLAGFFGHLGEVVHNKATKEKTDPFEVGKALRKKGIDPKYTCK